MFPDIIIFEKSFEQRYEEYMNILGSRGALSAHEVRNEWKFYIECVIEAGGWEAVWKISRSKCEELDIDFPTIILVMVDCVYFEELEAEVTIVAVQGDIHLPEKHVVPLKYLFPTKQDDSVLNIDSTANCLDQYRVFYNHLWRPWDGEGDENNDWVLDHLESRLKLFYDMKNGVISAEATRHIRSLLEEVREIDRKIADESGDENCVENFVDNNSVLTLMKLQLRREQIKREIEILESFEIRSIVMQKKQVDLEERKQTKSPLHEVLFVWLGGTVDELIQTLTTVKQHIQPDMHV
ncbi:hypothetical protein L9F63_023213, partial [Diploptera punctata]